MPAGWAVGCPLCAPVGWEGRGVSAATGAGGEWPAGTAGTVTAAMPAMELAVSRAGVGIGRWRARGSRRRGPAAARPGGCGHRQRAAPAKPTAELGDGTAGEVADEQQPDDRGDGDASGDDGASG